MDVIKSYEAVAQASGLSEDTKQRYLKYMLTRWRDTEEMKCKSGYAEDWAVRFKQGREFECSDQTGRSILRGMANGCNK
jgi:hypothetical protein